MTCLLAIETATDLVGCAVADSKGILAAKSLTQGRKHGELLASLVEDTIAHSGLAHSDFDCIAVDVGPGLYTGLRVGVATAGALAYAWDVPVVAVTSTEVLAFGAREFDGLVIPVVDAKRSEVFFAVYRAGSEGLEELSAVQVGGLDMLEQTLLSLPADAPKLLVGDGIKLLSMRFEAELAAKTTQTHPIAGVNLGSDEVSPSALAEFAVGKFESATTIMKLQADVDDTPAKSDICKSYICAAAELRPLYLRNPDIGPPAQQP